MEKYRTKAKKTSLRVCKKDIAAESIGEICDGENILMITNGDYSLIDVVVHCLDFTGPAHIDWATWTQGVYDQGKAYKLFQEKKIKSARWLVDPSIFQRRPELAGKMIERFGAESFRAVAIHAKFVSIIGENMSIAIRTSMNMNENKKFEQLEITADHDMCLFLKKYTDSVFCAFTSGCRSSSEKKITAILNKYNELEGPKKSTDDDLELDLGKFDLMSF